MDAREYGTRQDVRWCPGCGDYAILAAMKKALAGMGIPPEKLVFVSGIGCSSRFPYYMNTYGFHTIHGRALSVATGLKVTRPDLSVWVATGDGDALSIGGNHLIHTLRRNLDINILLFNNRVYGLTKGQYSPTSPVGHVTRTTPLGAIDHPVHALALALGCGATFVARTIDVHQRHLAMVLARAAEHRGTSLVEIYQNCVVFHDGAFEYATDRQSRMEATIELEHGKPLVFGKQRDQGIRLKGMEPEVVALKEGVTECDLLVHDERASQPNLAFLLSQMHYPEYPEPIGVFRAVERPTYDAQLNSQLSEAQQTEGIGDLQELFTSGDTWRVG